MSFEVFMGGFVLLVFLGNTLIIAAAALIEVRRLGRRNRRQGRMVAGTVTSAGVLARFVVEQRGRARQKSAGPILFHDRGTRTEVLGGTVTVGERTISIEPGAKTRVWIAPSVMRAHAACESPAAYATGLATATKAKGFQRDVVGELRKGDGVWLNPDDPSLLSGMEPRVWSTRRAILAMGFVTGSLSLAAAITAVILWPPVFGLVSTLGGVAGLGFFLAVQPVGVAVRDACRPPDRAYLRGVWKAPSIQHQAVPNV